MRKKTLVILLLSVVIFMAQACKKDDPPTETPFSIDRETLTPCDLPLARQKNDLIPIMDLSVINAEFTGHIDQFIDACKTKEQAPIAVFNAERATYQLLFEFDAIYPVAEVDITNYLRDDAFKITAVSIDVSIEPRAYKRVVSAQPLDEETTTIPIDAQARYIRISFSSTPGTGNQGSDYFGLNDVRFTVGTGYIVIEDTELTNVFKRYDGWTGADGIFSYNLSHGGNHIGATFDKMLLIFSDTIISRVNADTGVRQAGWKIINNSLGYYTPNGAFADGFEFVYEGTLSAPGNLFNPDHYIGFHPSNLISPDGFDVSHTPSGRLENVALGRMWRTDVTTNASILLDMKARYDVRTLYLWNDPVDPTYGIKTFELFAGDTPESMISLGEYIVPIAPETNLTAHQLALDLESVQARYLRIDIIDNHQMSATHYALGKIMIEGEAGRVLHAEVSAHHYLEASNAVEGSSRLWLQDSVIIGDYLYNFPILVKDFLTYFKVHQVGMSKIPIVDGVVDYANTIYMSTPLQVYTEDGGTIFYGAGVLNMSNHHDVDDPYVYIYGYKDLNGRHLIVARVEPNLIEDFNAWTYYDGVDFQSDITQSAKIIEGVSAELSVSYIPDGPYKDQYMLTVMENTTSGRVSVAFGATPQGPFGEYTLLYKTQETHEMNQVIVYNAKLHPLLSTADEWVVSYNVNGTSLAALRHVRVYHPRFLRIILVE